MKTCLKVLTCIIATLFISIGTNAQTWTYDFGTGTGSYTTNGVSLTFLPAPLSGGGDTARVRIGSGGGSFNLENPGLSDFGTGTELRGVAPTGGSVNKMSIVNYTPGKSFTMKFTVRFSGGSSGTWYFFQGDGAIYNDNNAFSGAQVFTGLRWVFGASGAITTSYRNGSSWTTLSGTPFVQDSNYIVEIYGNNTISSINYNYGTTQTVASNSFDLWINGTLMGNDLSKALLPGDANVDAWMFYGENSVGNVANIFLDDFTYSNSIEGTASNGPPIISSISRTTFVPATSATTDVQANITDDHNVSSAKLHVSVNGGSYDSSLTMTVVSGSTYGATIPISKHVKNGDLVEYFISAIDDSSAYSSSSVYGYFVGDSRIDSIKSHSVTSVNGYGARINGTLNIATNVFSNGSGYIQDASGGIRIFMTGMPTLAEGRNAKIEGTIAPRYNSYQLTTPNFSFVDTTLGTSAITPVTITLPTTKDSSYLNEGRVVKIAGMTTDSIGTFAAAKGYIFKEVDNDTISLYVESYGTANTVVGKNIPSTSTDVIGILAYYNTYMEIKPRKAEDLGLSTGDGSGIAAIVPATRLVGLTAVAETLTVTGDGVNTLEGVSIQIPLTWTWTNTTSYTLTGAFAGHTPVITGDGTTTPYVITITGLSLTNVNPGTIEIKNLNTPALSGSTQFLVKTRIVSGTLTSIASSPNVNVTANTFEAIATGNWNSSATWSGGIVPTATDDVTMTTNDVIVTITADAQCHNLTMAQVDTTTGTTGATLQFSSSGALTLAVNGKLDLSGSKRRPRLNSNGNTSAVLILKGKVFTSVSNTSANGDRGLNMNEGMVKFLSATNDTLKTAAGFRLANLVIGDGVEHKTLTWQQTSSATMNVRSIVVKDGSSFLVGTDGYTQANSIGNFGTVGLPMLNGGITIEPNANFSVLNALSGINFAYINIKDGGISNSGTFNLKSPNGSRQYSVIFGELSADSSGSKQTIAGSTIGTYSFVKIGALDTLTLNQSMNVDTLLLNGEVVETTGKTVVGVMRTTRTVTQGVPNLCGGIGAILTGSDATPETTAIYRVTGTPQTGGGNQSILRSFEFVPNNSGLNASCEFYYDDSELNGQDEATLKVWKSTDNGIFWIDQPTTVNTTSNKLSSFAVNSASRWTASDALHPIGAADKNISFHQGWNLISLPYIVADARKTLLFPHASSNAFYYEGIYKTEDTLKTGIGYWLKYAFQDTAKFQGVDRLTDTMFVVEGWNLIGSVSKVMKTVNIEQIPPNIVKSNYFQYISGYDIVDTLTPAMGFWVKTNSAGKLYFNPNLLAKGQTSQVELKMPDNSITITDNDDNHQTLYFGTGDAEKRNISFSELPPIGTAEIFDARFSSQRFVEVFPEKIEKTLQLPIDIQTKSYPLTISWHITESGSHSFILKDATNLKQTLINDGKLIISKPLNLLYIAVSQSGSNPASFSIGSNYPNPFNPVTKFVVSVPKTSNIEIGIYDILGRKIRSLMNEVKETGYYTLEWNGQTDANFSASSGMYFIRMTSEKFSATQKIMMVK